MVSANEYGWYVWLPRPIIVLEEVAQLPVLFGTVHTFHIHVIPKCLEIPADDQKIHENSRGLFQLLDLFVDFVELAVCATLNGDLL